MHGTPKGVLTDSYGEDEFYDDLLKVTKGNTDEELARLTIREKSESAMSGCSSRAAIFRNHYPGPCHSHQCFFLGVGKALVNAYYNRLESLSQFLPGDCS